MGTLTVLVILVNEKNHFFIKKGMEKYNKQMHGKYFNQKISTKRKIEKKF